eukprot:PRCOL_00004895-RA
MAADYYSTLGVSRGASDAQIKRAYRKLAMELHPDKNPGDEKAANKFADVNHAYEVLSDGEKRKVYDRHGEEGLKQHDQRQQQQGANPFGGDIFSQFFGGGFGQQREPETPKGGTVVIDVPVTLEELYLGGTRSITRDKNIIVPARGTRQCNCQMRMVTKQVGPGMFQQFQKKECDECPNVKMQREQVTLTLEVEPGTRDGHKLLFFEEGEPMVDGDPGDLEVRVLTAPHRRFSRDKSKQEDLHHTAKISLLDALTGFELELAHLDGHKVAIGATDVTRPFQVRTFKGKGMPLFESYNNHGDLHVTYEVDFPKTLTAQQKEQLRQLLK